LELSGYRLPIARSEACTKEERKEILRRIQLEWIEVNLLIKEEKRQREISLSCKSKRLPTGCYEYYDATSGEEIDAEE